VVQQLIQAGAIPIGKTNLDQFATGLVGTRSPYGICSSVFDSTRISGGSSSGSAVAVASGLVPFALGTDTAGSGRVPAAFNGLVGFKPTCGAWSTRGVVPACRTLDCVTVFSQTAEEAALIHSLLAHEDPADPYSRPQPQFLKSPKRLSQSRIGILSPSQFEFCGDAIAEKAYVAAVDQLRLSGATLVEIDFAPLSQVASMLYRGPWVAERYAAIRSFIENSADKMNPVVRGIIEGARNHSASDAFAAFYELEAARKKLSRLWETIDALFLPTAPTHYKIDEIQADPVRLNSNLGTYTNFVNLLDLSALALPAAKRSDGLPFGVTWIAPAFQESQLLAYAGVTLPSGSGSSSRISIAVVGAHLTGEPLNTQLTERKAELLRTCKTAPGYRLYKLQGGGIAKPGLIRDPQFSGPGIEVEVWSIDPEAFGTFTALVPPPLGIGNVELEEGTTVKGFICEPYAIAGCEEITSFGGWRAARRASS
jgi:allophanate hydrolase